MVNLRPCYINHKVARYNRTTPPSIRLHQKQLAAKRAAKQVETTTSTTEAIPDTVSRDLPTAPLHSSLRRSLQASQPAMNGQPSDTDDAILTSDNPPIYDDSDDDSQQDQVGLRNNSDLMNKTIIVPVSSPSAPVWTRAAKNRRALSAIDNPNSADIFSIEYEVKDLDCSTQTKKVVRLNYYSSLWLDDLDSDTPQWHFDIEIHHSENDDVCLESTPPYKVGSMTRGELFDYVDSFLKKFESRPPLDQLADIEADPGLMLGSSVSIIGVPPN
ncbi:uncharacterized protein PHALS_09001 [Plasmopara halstedii]|uniref:Uncharacterized protein n=1 Tax=Plasmopara halstedii TaxID=4781 RepID=A0A0P1ADR7_PLAHL|nr:uncharacterized protein PHALS_09001 [Plasmopara halstedii]CEG38958.1 hypothetical protein PHALS_09001 [Plasmopara halstedii]|eukprot:XP_024575327.1 hypothetical protein PHALS_09001 [Plasmopara halstedii]